MRCENCHRKIKNTADICPYCGRVVHKEQNLRDSKVQGSTYRRPNLSNQDNRTQIPEYKSSRKSIVHLEHKKKAKVLIAGMAVTLFMFIGVFFLIIHVLVPGNKEALIFSDNTDESNDNERAYYHYGELQSLGDDILQVSDQGGKVYINLDQITKAETYTMTDESQHTVYGVKLTLKDDYAKLLYKLLASAKNQGNVYTITCCKEVVNSEITVDQLKGNILIIKGLTNEEKMNEMVEMLNLALEDRKWK